MSATDPVGELLREVGLENGASSIEITGSDPYLPSRFPLGTIAAQALAAEGAAAAALWHQRTGQTQEVKVDVRRAAASLRSQTDQRLNGEVILRSDAGHKLVTRLHRTRDNRWIHLHGSYPHLGEGTLKLLGCAMDLEEITAAVAKWDAEELETALAEVGMCAAVLRSQEEWLAHPQGRAIASLPRVQIEKIGDSAPLALDDSGERPLTGVRVLDLTRVIAGPTCGRSLAAHGAEVLLISSPTLPSVERHVIDTGHGKRSAFLDLTDSEQAATLRALAKDADIFVQGFRPGALSRRGFGSAEMAQLRPGCIYVSLSCYGNTGPFRERAGWEQLAQTTSGIAAAEGSLESPKLLPALACDYITGYLASLGAMAALHRRATEGGSYHVQVSLCRTAQWIRSAGPCFDAEDGKGIAQNELQSLVQTSFGPLHFLPPAAELSVTPAHWAIPPVPLGTHPARW